MPGKFEYGNDLAGVVHGLDAIIFTKTSRRFVLCEAKGTTRRISENPLRYLKSRKRRGRQLSWAWCWSSLLRLVKQAHNSWLLLRVAGPLLKGQTDRLLVVSEVVRCRGGFRPTGKSQVWTEGQLSCFRELNTPSKRNGLNIGENGTPV